MKGRKMKKIIFDHGKPLIGAYYFFPKDLNQAKQELSILVESGVNHLWLFIDKYFRKDNPLPRAVFEEILALLDEYNLSFVPVIGEYISLEKHPEVRIELGDGTFSSDPRYWNMGCFRHPHSLEWAGHEVREFLLAYHDHKLLCRVDGKLLMSFAHEAYYRTDTPEMGGDQMRPNCYCPYCREAFIQYILTKYQDVAKYNRTHQTAIKNWQDLKLPRDPRPDPLLWVEFIQNHAEAIPNFLRSLIAVANEVTPVFSTHECNDFYPGSWQTTLTGNDIWKMAAETDLGHEDMYPLEFDQQYQIYIYGLLKDIMHSAMGFSRPYTGNGQAFTPWVIKARLPKNSLHEQVYTSLIHGVSGFVWWLGQDYQLWREMKAPNELLEWWLPRLAEFEPERARIALLYSYTTMTLAQNDEHPMDLQLLYMALRQLGIPVDIITEAQINSGVLEERDYRVLLLPAVSALSKETRDQLIMYVTKGGTLLADYAAEISVGEFCSVVEFSRGEPGERPRFYRTRSDLSSGGELFIPVESARAGQPLFDSGHNGRIWAEFDSGVPAVVEWPVGRGRIIGIGSMLGIDFSNFPGHLHLNKMFPFLIRMRDDARKLLALLLESCGWRPEIVSNRPEVEIGVFHGRGEQKSRLCWAVNHLPMSTNCTVSIRGGTEMGSASGFITKVEKVDGGLRVDLELPELSGAWFEIL